MGKRYYCDFCDRSFADTGVNRKNHFKGVQHQRAKKQHYDSFRGNCICVFVPEYVDPNNV